MEKLVSACVILTAESGDDASRRQACRTIESHLAPLTNRKQRGFPSYFLSGVVSLCLCQGSAAVDLRLMAEEVLLHALHRHGRVLGEKLVTEMIRYARKVAAPPSCYGEDIATAKSSSPIQMRPHTRGAALRALHHFCHQVRPAHARQIVANQLVPLLVEACGELGPNVTTAVAEAMPRIAKTLLAPYAADEDVNLIVTTVLDALRDPEGDDSIRRQLCIILSALCIEVPFSRVGLVVGELIGKGSTPRSTPIATQGILPGLLMSLSCLYEAYETVSVSHTSYHREKEAKLLASLLPEVSLVLAQDPLPNPNP